MRAYGIISDTHNHKWSAFSETSPDGINSRLQIILDETERCAAEVARLGGNVVRHAGDLFHVRGSISPSVLNPTRERYGDISRKYGVTFEILPGNHDMEMKESSKVGNAIEAMASGFTVIVRHPVLRGDSHVLMVPWIENLDTLKNTLEKQARTLKPAGTCDLIIHAPIDGVLEGLPSHGLTASYLASLGFARVFAGHYHNHKNFGNGVYSIGALTHHSWSDVGSKAGFLIVADDDVTWHASRAPSFIDIYGDMPESEIELLADGNYVRAKVTSSKMKDVNDLREWLLKCGAKGVVINPVKEPVRAREGAVSTVKAGASLETSIGEYIKSSPVKNKDEVTMGCLKILAEVA